MADGSDRHIDHDPLLVASLLDGDHADPQRAAALARVDTCTDCAALYADLLALSVATRAQLAPARPRDFRLTATDAARLRAEPVAAPARLTGVMTAPSTASAHHTHDTTLVASLADHSLAPTERAAAEALVASCTECATLRADVVALVLATRAMPTPPRPMDYSLTQDDARRLHGPWWRRLMAGIASSHDGVTRPLAVGLSTLGLVGLLIASGPTVLQMPGGLGGSAASSQAGQAARPADIEASAPANDTSGEAAPGVLAPTSGGAAAAAASGAPDRAAMSPAPVYGVTVQPIPVASAGQQTDGSGKSGTATAEASPEAVGSTADTALVARSSGPDPMLLVSAVFLLAGLGLFVLRWSARRLGDG